MTPRFPVRVLLSACVSLIVLGCAGTSSSPTDFFSPGPLALGVNPDSPSQSILYVGNPFTGPSSVSGSAPSAGTVTLVDLPAEAPRSSPLLAGGILQDLAASPDGRSLFVATIDSLGAGALLSCTTSGGISVAAAIPLPGTPGRIAASPAGDYLYIAASGTSPTQPGFLLAFSLSTMTQTARVPLGFTPTVLGLSPTGAVLIGNPVSGTIEYYFSAPAIASMGTVTDTALETFSIPVGGRVGGVSFSPDGTLAYATVGSTGMVSSIGLSGAPATQTSIYIGGIPLGIATAVTTGTLVFAANAVGNLYAVNFSTGAIEKPIVLGGVPRRVLLSGTRAYVTNSLSNAVDVIDTTNYSVPKILQ